VFAQESGGSKDIFRVKNGADGYMAFQVLTIGTQGF